MDPEERSVGVMAAVMGGLAAVLVIGAAGYFWLAPGGDPDIAAAPASSSAPLVAQAPRPPETPAPQAADPSAATSLTPPPADQPAADPLPGARPTDPLPGANATAPADAAAADRAPAGAAAPAPPAAMSDQPASLPEDEFVFVQRPRVNIRSAPSGSGRVVGKATAGERFKVVGRSGGWVEVERESDSGWISERLLGPQAP